jgi:hypothetical protein
MQVHMQILDPRSCPLSGWGTGWGTGWGSPNPLLLPVPTRVGRAGSQASSSTPASALPILPVAAPARFSWQVLVHDIPHSGVSGDDTREPTTVFCDAGHVVRNLLMDTPVTGSPNRVRSGAEKPVTGTSGDAVSTSSARVMVARGSDPKRPPTEVSRTHLEMSLWDVDRGVSSRSETGLERRCQRASAAEVNSC